MKNTRTSESSTAAAVLAFHVRVAEQHFLSLQRLGAVEGQFGDSRWKFRSRFVSFRSLVGVSDSSIVQIAKIIVIRDIGARKSWELVVSRVAAVRLINEVVGRTLEGWWNLRPHHLERCEDQLKLQGYKVATVYNRCGAVAVVATTVCGLEAELDGAPLTLVRRPFLWRRSVQNPIKSAVDPTTADFDAHRSSKFVDGLDGHVAEVRARVNSGGKDEPWPGYFRIRVEAFAFLMAMGMRVGQLVSLHVGCLESEQGEASLAVPAQKGFPATRRPIPRAWLEAVEEAHRYLVSACAEARARARLIEKSGFRWVHEELLRRRKSRPEDLNVHVMCRLHQLDPDLHFTVEEVCSAFALSKKEFSGAVGHAAGTYRNVTVNVTAPTIAKILLWVNDRLARWDWADCLEPGRVSGCRPKSRISMKRLSFLVRCAYPTLKTMQGWGAALSELLAMVDQLGGFERESAGPGDAGNVRVWWDQQVTRLMESGVGRRRLMINVENLMARLESRYAIWLGRHYSINISASAEGRSRLDKVTPLSEHLFVVWERQFNGAVGTLGMLPRPMTRGDIYDFICANSAKRTVFEVFDVRDKSGSVVSLTPHQFRHWLHTAVRKSGAPEMLVDLWMGRKPGQGRHYDHRTAKERAEYIRKSYLGRTPPADFLGRTVKRWREDGMRDTEIEHLISVKLQAVHFVPWGQCSRDLTASPCEKGLMCLRGFGTGTVCPSFHIDPSDSDALTSIQRLRSKYLLQLEAFEPNVKKLRDAFSNGDLSTQTLDQHLSWMLEVIAGCEAAIQAYERPMTSSEPLRSVLLTRG